MPGARSLLVGVSISLLALSACTTIAPVGQTSSPSAPAASTPVAVSGEPVALLTDAPSPELPTDEPVDNSTEPPSETEPPLPEMANLHITDLTFDPERPVPGEEIDALLTLKNTGGTEASAPISAKLGGTALGTADAITEVDFPGISGLAPGDSVQVLGTFSVPADGTYSLFVVVDPENAVDESSEGDNRIDDVELATLSAPNLAFVENSFQILPKDDGTGGYYATLRYTNSGTAVLDQAFHVRFFYFTEDGTQGEFGTSEATPVTVPPGEAVTQTFEFAVEPGSYLGYSLLDSDDEVVETDETDNEARYDFTAP